MGSDGAGRRAWRNGASLGLLAAFLLTPPGASADIANWIAGDGNYSAAANWDTNPLVPLNNGVTYDVFIVAGSNIDVTYDSAGSGAVDSLNLGAGFTFLTDTASSAFTAGATFANDASLIAEDGSTLHLGGGNLDRSNLIAREGFLGGGGAMLTTTVSSWTGTTGFNLYRSFTADGALTLLDLSSLTTVVRSGGHAASGLNISATDGGEVRLTGITGFDDHASLTNGGIDLTSSGAGSKLDISGVTTISDVDIEVRDGGDIVGQLVSITGRSSLLKRGLDDADGTPGVDMIDLSLLTSADNATLIAEDGATLALGSASIDQADLIAREGFLGGGGAMLTTTVSSWTGTTGFNLYRSFTADGALTLLDLSSLTTVVRSGGHAASGLNISATDGGEVRLTGITGFADHASLTNGGIDLTSSGAGSKLDISGVTTISDVDIEVRDGGDIVGQLVSITGRSSLLKRGLDDADGTPGVDMIDLSLLTSADNATLIAEDGATLALGSASIDQADLIAREGFLGGGGAMLTTTVSSWTGTTGFNLYRSFTADGALTLLDLSSLTTVVRSGGHAASGLNISATDGGEVRLTGITGFDDHASLTNGGIDLTSSGAGSKLDISGVTTISDVDIEVRDGGDIVGQLVSITGRSSLLKRGLDDADGTPGVDMIDLSLLTSADNATLIAEDGATLALGSASIDQADLIAREGFLGGGGAMLTTTVTSWTGTTGFNLYRSFTADGALTLLDLSSLTTVVRSGGHAASGLNISATDGGEVRLTGITGFADHASLTNGGIDLTSSGAGSKLDISGVTTISDVDIEVRDGGDIVGQLVSITGRSSLLKRGLDDADGTPGVDMIDLSLLTSADNATLIAEDGATLALGSASIDQADLIAREGFLGGGGAMLTTTVSSWTGTTGFNLYRSFTADGALTLLDLSSLTTVVRSGGHAASGLNISATDGGEVRLTGITGFDDHASMTNGGIDLTSSGAGSHINAGNVTALDNADVTLDDDATIDLGKLGAFSDGTIEMKSTSAGASDLHLADHFALGAGGVVDVAGSTAAVVVGPGMPAGAADGTLTVAFGGSLSGTGTVIGDLVNLGLTGPGSSPGVLTVDGAYQQDAAAVLAIEIGGLLQGTEFDLLDISGSASLAGDVEVSLFDGYLPNLGDSFVILEAAGGISGLFGNVFCSNCTDVVFELVHGANSVTLNTVAAPVPVPAALWLLLSALAGIRLTRRAQHGSA